MQQNEGRRMIPISSLATAIGTYSNTGYIQTAPSASTAQTELQQNSQ